VLFALDRMEQKQMTAVAEALNEFEAADREVKRLMGYAKIKAGLGKKLKAVDTNLQWMRNRAKEMDGKLEAQEVLKNHQEKVLPGSPMLDNLNGVASAKPGQTIEMDSRDTEAGLVRDVYAELGISITKHPLEIYKDLKKAKANSFQKFIVLQNLSDRIMRDPVLMEGLTKGEKQDMIWVMIAFLKSVPSVVNAPKHFRGEYDSGAKIVDSAIYVWDMLEHLVLTEEARKKKEAETGEKPVPRHLSREAIGWTVEMFDAAMAAIKTHREVRAWEQEQKWRLEQMNGKQ
jgi:hypothetical protein